ADLPIMAIRLNPRRMPVALPRIVDGVHHEAVDVGDGQVVFLESVADGLLLFFKQERRPGVRHIGHDLDAHVADGGETAHCLVKGIIQICVGAKGKLHNTIKKLTTASQRTQSKSQKKNNQKTANPLPAIPFHLLSSSLCDLCDSVVSDDSTYSSSMANCLKK